MASKTASPSSTVVQAPAATASPTPKQEKHPARIKIEISEKHRRELRQAFDLFDTDGTGRIQATEVKVALRALGFETKKEELRALLHEAGTNLNQTVDFNEFLSVILFKMGEKETKEEVQRAFRHFDEADKGFISFEDVKQISAHLEQNLTEDELKEMMDFAQSNKSSGPKKEGGLRDVGNISEEDFLRIMKRANVY
jgi:Ca2+-binding EF-hand superfamily protein